MHLLAMYQKILRYRLIIMLPQCVGVVANITVIHLATIAGALACVVGSRRIAHLMVISPIPAKMAMIPNNNQNDWVWNNSVPRISIR